MESAPAKARIHAHSRRQAMDWSLVLVSQGIEPSIDYAQDGGGWGLLVEPNEYEPAIQAIRQYRRENRGWPWQRTLITPGLVFDWASLAWVLLLLLFYWLNNRTDLHSAGIMNSTAVAHGAWWRLFTAMWLHADLAHLGTNASLGLVLLGLAMGAYGTGVGLLAASLAGAGGNIVASIFSSGPHYSLGASGMVMGCLGLLAAQSLSLWRHTHHAPKHILTGIAGGVMLFVLLGLTPGTDIMAHLGGFLSGLLLGAILVLKPSASQNPWINALSGFLFATLVVVPWWLALRPANLGAFPTP